MIGPNAGAMTLGTERVGTLLRQYAVPAIIAMTASSLYNMVDSIFIGQGVGALAISGLALTFPLMNLSAAFGTLAGLGCATLISVKLGQRDYATSQKILGNCVTLNIIVGILLTIGVLSFLTPILYFFGGSDDTVGYARDYMEIIIWGNIITHLYFGLNAMLRSTGHPRQAMNATIVTVLLNTALDPLFIWGFGMGIRGAAIATVLSQAIALGWELWVFSRPAELVHFNRHCFHTRWKIARESLSIGMSPFLMNSAACIVVILINQSLSRHGGDLAIGAYGVANRLAFVVVMVVFGFNQAMQPIAGYNYGARKYGRVRKVLWLTIGWATAVMLAGFAVYEIFAETAVRLFTNDEQLMALSARGLRILVSMFPLIGAQIVISNFFQSIGKPAKAILLSLSRQVLVLVPLLLVLPRYFGVDGVWASLPLSDAIASVMAAVLLMRESANFKRLQQAE